MKNINYIVSAIFIYFGGATLMASLPISILLDLPASSIPLLSLLPYYLFPMIGILEILIAVSLLHASWNRYTIRLTGLYLLIGIALLVAEGGVSFSDSPFLLSFSFSAMISHICLLVVVFMLIKEDLKQSALRA